MKYRKIHIGEKVWEWLVGNSTVVIVEPDGKKHMLSKYEVLGNDPGEYKDTVPITPGYIRAYIENTIIKGKPVKEWSYRSEKYKLQSALASLYFDIDKGREADIHRKMQHINTLFKQVYK